MRRALLSDSLKIIGHSYNNNNLSSSTWRHACNSRSEIAEIVEKFQVEQSKLNKARARSAWRLRPSDIQTFHNARARIQSLGPSAAASGSPRPRWAPPASRGPSTSSAKIADRVKKRLGRKSISQLQRAPRQVRSGAGAQSNRAVTQSRWDGRCQELHT